MACKDCGEFHETGLSAIRCDYRVGRPTPGLTDEERLELLLREGFQDI